jgi:hypothetical protein
MNLTKILKLDAETKTSSLGKFQRNNLLHRTTENLATLRRIWKLKPTLDTTLSYTPYLQKYSLSCEIAALSMVLTSLGSPETEDAIIARLPQYPLPYSGGVW